MNIPALDAVILAACSIPLVMSYRILPVDGTPYYLFAVIFGLFIANILFSLRFNPKNLAYFQKFKNIFTAVILTLVLGGVMWTAIADRGKTAPGQNDNVHDFVLQLEAALRFLGQNKNPYYETYFNTPMAMWHYSELGKDAVNPALYHFVTLPWYVVFSYPFYFISMRTIGYFDARMPLLFCVIGLGLGIYLLFKHKELGRLATIIVLLNPATVNYLIEGRSDLFVLFWLIFSLVLLFNKHYRWSALVFGLAMISKQTVWFLLPLYLGYIWIIGKRSWLFVARSALIITAVSAVLCLPFLIWNAKAFIDSVIFFVSGSTSHGYPVSGYGLGMILYDARVIKNIHDYYPFFLWQAIFGGLSLIIGFLWMRRKLSINRLLISHAVSLFIFWYTSRYFNNSHIAYISALFILGMLKESDENHHDYEISAK
jgi:hypothetical protein